MVWRVKDVQLNPRGNIRPSLDQEVIHVAGVADRHEGRAGRRSGEGGSGMCAGHLDVLREGHVRKEKGRGHGRDQCLVGHIDCPFCLR